MREKVRESIAKAKLTLPHLLLSVLVVMLALLVSCSGQAPVASPESTIPSYIDVSPEEAYEMIDQQEVVVLDVRTQEEYDSGHIPDALLIPLSELESRLDELNMTDHILVYCRSGHRSREAASILISNNFIHVYNMEGGIVQWQAQGFPVYTDQTPETSSEPKVPGYTDITAKEAHEMISQQEVVIVDLRTQKKYNSGHIPDALHIPLSELESRLGELNKTAYILVYHSCCPCSKKGAQFLVDNGFLHIYNLEGGFGQWQAQGFPVTLTYTDITAEEAYDMIGQQEVVVLDVRTQEEYDSGHIPDVLLIPLSELESRLDELNTTDHILVYCRSGHRSEEAAQILVTNGFVHVYNMEGGIVQWQAQGFPVT